MNLRLVAAPCFCSTTAASAIDAYADAVVCAFGHPSSKKDENRCYIEPALISIFRRRWETTILGLKGKKMDIKKIAAGVFAMAMTTVVAQDSYADRIRTCNFVMTDTVALVDGEFNIVGTFEETMVGTTAGRHGGVQANTARGRARDRFNACRSNWVFGSSNGATQPIFFDQCKNSNVGSGTGNDVVQQSNNLTYNDYIVSVFSGDVCAFVEDRGLDANSLSLLVIGNESETSGGNRCGSSRSDDFGQFGRFVAAVSAICS